MPVAAWTYSGEPNLDDSAKIMWVFVYIGDDISDNVLSVHRVESEFPPQLS